MGVKYRYFILERTYDLNEFRALDVSIGANDTQRYSLDSSKIMIITKKVNSKTKPILGKEYSYEEIKNIMKTPEWQEEIIEIC